MSKFFKWSLTAASSLENSTILTFLYRQASEDTPYVILRLWIFTHCKDILDNQIILNFPYVCINGMTICLHSFILWNYESYEPIWKQLNFNSRRDSFKLNKSKVNQFYGKIRNICFVKLIECNEFWKKYDESKRIVWKISKYLNWFETLFLNFTFLQQTILSKYYNIKLSLKMSVIDVNKGDDSILFTREIFAKIWFKLKKLFYLN